MKEKTTELRTDLLVPFKDHPFKVAADYPMIQLQESIKRYGILNPLIVRPMEDDNFEIVSGHRRKYAAEQLGLEVVPVIIRNMTDDEAIMSMIDSNLQREVITYSEKAFAYKMKNEVLKKPHAKQSYNFNKAELKTMRRRVVDLIGAEMGESAKQVQRYLKVTELIPELLQRLDDGLISFNPAFEIAFLSPENQQIVLDAMDYAQCAPSVSQAQRIKKLSKEGILTKRDIYQILSEPKKGELDRVTFKTTQLRKYFPKEYSIDQMRMEMLDALKEYTRQKFE